jgi:PKD repeat protein
MKRYLPFLFFLQVIVIQAQPVNDHCSNAAEIIIPAGGFGIGAFYSDTIDLTSATLQMGEVWHSVQISAGNDKKSIWYKFYLPTARGVNIELMQEIETIPQDGAGFTVYKAENCIPGLADIPPAKLTPVNKFGSTFNPCLLPGWYYIQVGAKNASSGEVHLELTTSMPGVLNNYDLQPAASSFGTISGGWHTKYYEVGCQTIDNAAETCPALGANYEDYTQSVWFVFTTDNFVDLITLQMGEQSGYFTGNFRTGYNIYEGDVRTTPYTTLPVIDGCRIMTQPSSSYLASKNYLCVFQPNTTYSIQLFFHKEYSNAVQIRLYERGSGITKSPYPPSIDPTSELGLLAASPAGTWTYGYDVFACNAFISDNICGTVNPASGQTSISGYTFRLATWYTFELSDDANVRFYTDGGHGKKLYYGDVTTNCNLTPTNEFNNGDITFNCLPPGKYSLQLLGKIDTSYNYVTSAWYNNIGNAANLSLQVFSININNDFLLDATGKFDSVNVSGGIWDPLPDNVIINAHLGRFSCQKTVLPAGSNCYAPNNRAMYREIIIGDSDGNGTDDEGVLNLSNGNYYFHYLFYRGDANALATAQGAFSWGETITGLETMTTCTNLYSTSQNVCVTPGIYTLVSFGDSTDVSRTDEPRFRFRQVSTQFDDPAAPNNLGDITAALMGGSVSGTIDYWSCLDNPLTIDGKAPCASYNKLIYREFYLSTPMVINITLSGGGQFRIFSGRISDGVGTVSSLVSGYGDLGCRSSFYGDVCRPFQPGWYTVVCYGYGGTYSGPTYMGGLIGGTNNITISRVPFLNPPNYNRPFKAYNAGITDWGPNAGTPEYPVTHRTYTFGTERMDCIPDTPFSAHPIIACPGFNRVAYYVFTVTQESFISIRGIPSSMHSKLYAADVRTDSLLFPGLTPVQECLSITNISSYERAWWTWYGKMEVCQLQAGTYTLVVFGNNSHINTTFTPTLYVDEVEESRFDFADNAYDFGIIPADSAFHYGKTGDVNPYFAGRAPSNDFFTCTTGAFNSDPGQADPNTYCWDGLFPNASGSSVPYPMGFNYPYYQNTTNVPIRRNLWYTFVIDGPGIITVKVENKTPGKTTQYPWVIYRSDVDGTLDYATVVASGLTDSTLAQGLTYIRNSSYTDWYGCAGNHQTLNFSIDPCGAHIMQRYYVVVDHHAGLMPNNQVEVSVRHVPDFSVTSNYDNYSDANVINGLGETAPPYTPVELTTGQYQGAMSSFACATKAPTDQNTCGTRTLWYKFTSATSGKVRIQYEIPGTGRFFNTNEIKIFREIIPGDSTVTGLQMLSPTAITVSGQTWGETCLNTGTYYIMLTGCSYTIENVIPHIWILTEYGDLCEEPIEISMPAPGIASASVVINCHSIGEDFGEDGSNMGCLFGPSGYKSTWFKVDLDFTDKVDLTFQLSESTTALPNQIRYRILYGDCNAMTAGPCNSDALTEFTLNCMMSDSVSYYVQVVSPANATGSITLTVTAVPSPNQTCEPFNPNKPTANFTFANQCLGDLTCFTNQSTLGDSIVYQWQFIPSDPTATATDLNPCYQFPDTGTYMVSLIVTNIVLGTADTVIIPVAIYPIPDPDISHLPDTNEIITGTPIDFFSNVTVTITNPNTTYYWDFSNGMTSDQPDVNGIIYDSGNLGETVIFLTVANGNCVVTVTDTIYNKTEPIYKGGPYDGAVITFLPSLCPPDSIFTGGFYDGSVLSSLLPNCVNDTVFTGGPYDGATMSQIISVCPPEAVFVGGDYDGASGFYIIGNCPPEDVFTGGPFDGSDVFYIIASCPPEDIFAGGPYDGATHSYLISNCPPEEIFAGGYYDGASLNFYDCTNPLPVELLYLNATWKQNDGLISWATVSEMNNLGFEIQRCEEDCQQWTSLGFITGNGNTNEMKHYFFLDINLMSHPDHAFYFRLRQIDFDGKYIYSDIVSLSKDANQFLNDAMLSVWPNPASENDEIILTYYTSEVKDINIQITDVYGQILLSEQINSEAGINLFRFSPKNLAQGTYFISIFATNIKEYRKFIIAN